MPTWISTAWLLGGLVLSTSLKADALDDRMHQLSSELRCLVCQNESLADSHAPLALDLKREIRARMQAGDSDEQLRSFLVERYGDFVSYRPPVTPRTWLLWAGPLLMLGAGACLLTRSSLRRPTRTEHDHA